jgi:hypothetical protein
MPGTGMIVGLPDILYYFFDFFRDLFLTARQSQAETVCVLSADEDVSSKRQNIVFSGMDMEESEEEKDTYEPCSFTLPLAHMSKSYGEALREYNDQFKDHVSEGFAQHSNIKALLQTELALNRFVPKKWEGLRSVEPIELQFKDTLPSSMKPKARPINPRLHEQAKAEFQRLSGYMYVPSDSPVASCLVCAPKATPPYIRLCGDYRIINQHVAMPQAYIPHVQHELEKAQRYKIFLDLDLTNAFHQIPIGERTSKILSIQTPWGLVRPAFLPEGVSPVSGVLHSTVSKIFEEYKAWMIVIFDNVLLLANDYQEAYEKLQLFLARCEEYNIILKFAKTWLGFDKASFFGYQVTQGKYELTKDRKQAILDVPMPSNTKGMQRFLGAALFFKNFVPDFSQKTANLTEMTHKNFNWDEKSWQKDYRHYFDECKQALANSVAIHIPDYELPWIMRVDASDDAVGAVLMQIRSVKETQVHEPIGFASKKFTSTARRWDTFKKEAFAIYFGVSSYAYYLRGKPLVLETDHRNLVWMESSIVPIVIRWRVYLQSFDVTIRHISGTKNMVADWLSRANLDTADHNSYVESDVGTSALGLLSSLLASSEEDTASELPPTSQRARVQDRAEYLLKQIHGGRNLHYGARRTWRLLNQVFPGHGIPYRKVEDFISSCPICQKDRIGMTDFLLPSVRHLKPPHWRARVGVDQLTITPQDIHGNCVCVVIVDHFSKHE